MKKTVLLILLVLPAILYSSEYSRDILEKVDSLANFPNNDFSAEYTIVQEIPLKGRKVNVAGVFRRDSSNTYTIIISKPDSNKGQGYLKQNNTLWFYDPESGSFNSTSSKDRFQNSNARNSDFTRSTLAEDYNIVNGKNVKLGKYNCWLLELEANNDEVTYPKMKIWISDDYLVRKTEDYSLSGQLLRTTIIPFYQSVGDKKFPKKMLYIEHLVGAKVDGKFQPEKTQITIDKPSLKGLPDSVFSKSFLESVSK